MLTGEVPLCDARRSCHVDAAHGASEKSEFDPISTFQVRDTPLAAESHTVQQEHDPSYHTWECRCCTGDLDSYQRHRILSSRHLRVR